MRRTIRCLVLFATVAAGSVLAAPGAPAAPSEATAGVASTITIPAMPTGPDRFVDAAYHDFLGRASEPTGRAYWVRKIGAGTSRTTVASSMTHSNEWTTKVVAQRFDAVIGRAPTAAESARWVAPLRANTQKVTDLVAWLYGTGAYYSSVGSTNAKWVDALYAAVAFRVPTATERTAAVNRLKTTARATEARRVVLAVEANGFRVDDLYQLLFGRSPDPGGRAYWAKRLVDGDDLKLAAQLAGSSEYNTKAQARVLEGSIEKPATTSVATAAQVKAFTGGAASATVTVAAAAAPTGTEHISLPISGPTPGGYLGEVTARTTNTDGSVTLALTPAPWDEAFPSGHVEGRVDLGSVPGGSGTSGPTAGQAPGADTAAGPFTCAAGVNLRGDPFPHPYLDVDADWGVIDGVYLKFVLGFTAGVEIEVKNTAAIECQQSLIGGGVDLPPVTIGPIVLVPSIDVIGQVSAQFGSSWKASYSKDCKLGFEYEDGDTHDLTGCSTRSSPPASADGVRSKQTFTGGIGIELSIKAYGIIGLSATFGVQIEAVFQIPSPWVKISSSIFADLELTLDKWFVHLFVNLAHFECCKATLYQADGPAPPAPPLDIPTAGLPDARRTDPYTATITATGGVPPYEWTSSELPDGLVLGADTGTISGTPTTLGTTVVTVTVTDQEGNTTTRDLDLVVVPRPPLAITTLSLPPAVVSRSYYTSVAATGGRTPYSWSATGLPSTLTMSSFGIITGTPTSAATYPVTIKITDADGTALTKALSLKVSARPTADAVVTGNSHSCALRSDSTIRCWGHGSDGALGDGNRGDPDLFGSQLTPVTVAGVNTAVAITAGFGHTCALLVDKTIRCWGLDQNGQLGDGTTGEGDTGTRLLPVAVVGIADATSVSAGSSHTCAVRTGGTVSCWGSDVDGQLGNGPAGGTVVNTAPVTVTGVTNAISVSAGGSHTCALLVGGSVKCWGKASMGQLGDGTTGDAGGIRSAPVTVTGLPNAIGLDAGNDHTCALLSTGGAKCWGHDMWGQLGDGTSGDYEHQLLTATTVVGLTGANDIDAGERHTCASLSNGTMRCWGDAQWGQLGDGTTGDAGHLRTTPTTVAAGGLVIDISTGGRHSCLVTSDGQVECMGNSNYGQVGAGVALRVLDPVELAEL
jgi:alpha-tubulin suppressor-like RCC1 family protein